MTDVRVVLITAPDAAAAEKLARALVEERLAACVNVLPGVHSFYRWEGSVQDDAELLLVAKTRAERVGALAARVKAAFSVACPRKALITLMPARMPPSRCVTSES